MWSQVSFLREGKTKCSPATNTKEPGEVAVSIDTPHPSQGSRLWARVRLPEPLPSCLGWGGPSASSAQSWPLSAFTAVLWEHQQPMPQPEPAGSTGLKLRAITRQPLPWRLDVTKPLDFSGPQLLHR